MNLNSSEFYSQVASLIKEAGPLHFDRMASKPTTNKCREMSIFKISNPNLTSFQLALKNPDPIARLEHINNGGQSVHVTTKQIEIAAEIDVEDAHNYVERSFVNSLSHLPISEVFVNIKQCLKRDGSQLVVLCDDQRRELIQSLFQTPPELVSSVDDPRIEGFSTELKESHTYTVNQLQEVVQQRFHTTQIIFESGDYISAFDALIVNQSDRLHSPWRIRTIFIEESLKQKFDHFVGSEQFVTSNETSMDGPSYYNENLNVATKRMGGRIIQNANKTISLVVGISTKYVNDMFPFLVTVNFFRTPKDLYQLIKNEQKPSEQINTHFTSIWTENVSLLYEVVIALNSTVIWGNCLGIFDGIIPCPLASRNWAVVPDDYCTKG